MCSCRIEQVASIRLAVYRTQLQDPRRDVGGHANERLHKTAVDVEMPLILCNIALPVCLIEHTPLHAWQADGRD